MLRTLGAPQRRLLGRRRPKAVDAARGRSPSPPRARRSSRRSRTTPRREADAWLEAAAGDSDDVVAAATRELNFVLRSHRAAAGDPYARDVRADHALVVRLGYGEGEQVADGRFGRAVELPKEPPKRKRGEALAPQERLAAILGGRDTLLVGEELLLRAQLDLDAGRTARGRAPGARRARVAARRARREVRRTASPAARAGGAGGERRARRRALGGRYDRAGGRRRADGGRRTPERHGRRHRVGATSRLFHPHVERRR